MHMDQHGIYMIYIYVISYDTYPPHIYLYDTIIITILLSQWQYDVISIIATIVITTKLSLLLFTLFQQDYYYHL